jgi:2-polyprenyl-6-methoxyphenol hydroxylase-like FAD-dependent oxidoreductase
MTTHGDRSVELLVVGAGPVGLMAATAALQRGLSVELIDQSARGFGPGHATLLHPGSLRLLSELGVLPGLHKHGRELTGVGVHADGAPRVRLELATPALAVPQTRLEETLLGAFRARGGRVHAPIQASTVQPSSERVQVRVVRRELVTLGSPADYSEWQPVESSTVTADFVLGADGYDSRVRSALGLDSVEVGKTEMFAMFEVPLASDPGSDIEIGFTDGLSCSFVPLSDSRARFAFQLDAGLDREADVERLRELVRTRAPFLKHAIERVDFGSVIHFERRLVRRFGSGRVWLAGDAAHVTSPLGAQSMNLGLVEAHGFVEQMAACARGKARVEALDAYALARQREWHKLLGFHVKFELAAAAPKWLGPLARRISPVLPASGDDLRSLLDQLGLRVV